MPDRVTILAKIAVGDIFHAEATNGASLLCLTMSVSESTIQARNVATQIIYDFDRRMGHADWFVYGTHYTCLIDSVAPLPPDIHEIMLSLDRRYRESEYREAEDPDREWGPGEAALTEEQKRGLHSWLDFIPPIRSWANKPPAFVWLGIRSTGEPRLAVAR